MDHLLLELIATILVTLVTMVASLIIPILATLYSLYVKIKDLCKLYFSGKKTRKERDHIIEVLSPEVHKEISEKILELDKINISEKMWNSVFSWGVDFSSLAFTLGFISLANGAINNEFVPFFLFLQSKSAISPIAIGLIFTSGYFFAYCVAVFLKHMHKSIRLDLDYNAASISEEGWIRQNKFFIIGFLLGISSFFTSFIIITFKT